MATVDDLSAVVRDLVESLRRAHQLCEATGDNLPEQLRTALKQLAEELGGTDQLVRHRPGSWKQKTYDISLPKPTFPSPRGQAEPSPRGQAEVSVGA